jgi:hypothetical protein
MYSLGWDLRIINKKTSPISLAPETNQEHVWLNGAYSKETQFSKNKNHRFSQAETQINPYFLMLSNIRGWEKQACKPNMIFPSKFYLTNSRKI